MRKHLVPYAKKKSRNIQLWRKADEVLDEMPDF